MEMTPFIPKKRLIFFFLCLGILIFAIVISYGKAMMGPELPHKAIVALQERGSILDRKGKILAVQTTLYNIGVTRSAIKDVGILATLISPHIGMSESEITARISDAPNDFFYLKKKISENEKMTIAELLSENKIKGLRFEAMQSRTYPENKLASHVIGFLGDDGIGLTGAEYSFENILSPINNSSTKAYNVMLTIDSTIQYRLEKIAETTMEETEAEALIMIAADAKSGEILAYISEPSANLNQYTTSSLAERTDRPALFSFEPGSVFKIFTISAILDLGIIQDSDIFYCDGAYTFSTPRGETISIKCLDSHGWVTARDAIRLSCNDGTAQIVEKVDPAVFEQKIRSFGFGSKTGIELPGETAGSMASSNTWSLRTKPTIAIGQEIAVSALQMVAAGTALANEGNRLQLTLLSKLYSRDGEQVYQHVPKVVETVLSAKTAALMLDYMFTTSETGTGTRASVGGVPMAVKTGTAQMQNDEKTGYSKTNFISSCIGLFPADNPTVIIYVAIVKPVGETYGGRIAAPVVSSAANEIIDYLGMSRTTAVSVEHTGVITVPKNKPVELGEIMPDLKGVSKRMLMGILDRYDLIISIEGDGYVSKQSPPAGTILEKGMKIELYLE